MRSQDIKIDDNTCDWCDGTGIDGYNRRDPNTWRNITKCPHCDHGRIRLGHSSNRTQRESADKIARR